MTITTFLLFIIALPTRLLVFGVGILLGLAWCVSLFENKGGRPMIVDLKPKTLEQPGDKARDELETLLEDMGRSLDAQIVRERARRAVRPKPTPTPVATPTPRPGIGSPVKSALGSILWMFQVF